MDRKSPLFESTSRILMLCYERFLTWTITDCCRSDVAAITSLPNTNSCSCFSCSETPDDDNLILLLTPLANWNGNAPHKIGCENTEAAQSYNWWWYKADTSRSKQSPIYLTSFFFFRLSTDEVPLTWLIRTERWMVNKSSFKVHYLIYLRSLVLQC